MDAHGALISEPFSSLRRRGVDSIVYSVCGIFVKFLISINEKARVQDTGGLAAVGNARRPKPPRRQICTPVAQHRLYKSRSTLMLAFYFKLLLNVIPARQICLPYEVVVDCHLNQSASVDLPPIHISITAKNDAYIPHAARIGDRIEIQFRTSARAEDMIPAQHFLTPDVRVRLAHVHGLDRPRCIVGNGEVAHTCRGIEANGGQSCCDYEGFGALHDYFLSWRFRCAAIRWSVRKL